LPCKHFSSSEELFKTGKVFKKQEWMQMSELERNEVIKYRLSLKSPSPKNEPADFDLTLRRRLQTAKSHNDYSYADNFMVQVRLNQMKNEAKKKQMIEQQSKHIMLQTSPNRKDFSRE
jgi:hypothetical protein